MFPHIPVSSIRDHISHVSVCRLPKASRTCTVYLVTKDDTFIPCDAVINVHTLSRFVLPPYHQHVPTLPGQNFSLMGVLIQLGCRPQIAMFRNAENEAMCSLCAMLLLAALNRASRKAELTAHELANLDTIERAVSRV